MKKHKRTYPYFEIRHYRTTRADTIYRKAAGRLEGRPRKHDLYASYQFGNHETPSQWGGETALCLHNRHNMRVITNAVCSYSDQFSRKLGRSIALGRMLAYTDMRKALCKKAASIASWDVAAVYKAYYKEREMQEAATFDEMWRFYFGEYNGKEFYNAY